MCGWEDKQIMTAFRACTQIASQNFLVRYQTPQTLAGIYVQSSDGNKIYTGIERLNETLIKIKKFDSLMLYNISNSK